MKVMKKTYAAVTALSAAILMTACTSTPTKTLAVQKPNNQYEVTAVGKTSIAAKNNAIAAANSTCGKNASPIVVDEKQEYNGVLKGVVDEKTGQMIQAAAGVLGTITGNSGSISKDDDYQTVLTFTCQAK